MADFCKQCSIDHFGEDFGDLANLGGEDTKVVGAHYDDDTVWAVICEGCGPTYVNNEGECVHDCLEHHKR